jgi:predicted phosphodiesterase
MRTRFVAFLTLIILATSGSMARKPDGTLGLIRSPNNAKPVIITTEMPFEILSEKEAILSLSGISGSSRINVSWVPRPGGLFFGLCRVDSPLPPGTYALHAETNLAETDVNLRSVYITESFPESYMIAHITDTHVTSSAMPELNTDTMHGIIEALNTSTASFSLITGDLTENGESEQFLRFIKILDMINMPTFVVPGNHDRQKENYEHFFGSSIYSFVYGQDGYLAFDTKDFLIVDEMGEQNGFLQYYRRKVRASRWSIGFTHRYDLTMGFRAQIILFIDDPLDFLIYGHYHREAENQEGIPWGNTPIIMTPAAKDGMLRFLNINAQGVQAQKTISTLTVSTGNR